MAYAADRPSVNRDAFAPLDAGEGVLRSWDVVNVGDGFWTDPSNWLPAGAPANTDDIRLFQGDATNRTVTYDQASGITLNSLRVDATGNGQMTLSQPAFALTTNELVVGIFGKGQYNLSGGTLQTGIGYVGAINNGGFTQTGGRHINSVFLSVGNNLGSNGTYTINAGTISGSELDVGYFGSGTFIQQGGSVTASQFYGVGFADTGVGTYLMAGGTLLTPAGYVGLYGTGTFVQGGGVQTVLGNLSVGETDTGRGWYTLAGGTVNANELNVGYEGHGTLNTAGSAAINAGTFFVAAQPNSRGVGTLSSSGLTSVTNEMIVGTGTNSIGSVTQTAGVVNVGGDLSLGFEAGAVGNYNLVDGTLSSNKLKVGYIGNGNFVQLLGRNTVTTYLSIADQAASNSIYTLRRGDLVVGELEVGYRGVGQMLQDGGTVDVGSFTAVGFVTSGRGLYTLLPGGTLNSPSTYVGLYGDGTFAQSGGLHNVPGVLSVGENTGASGTYNIGSTARIIAGEFDVGFQGTGVVNQNGGTITANELNVAAQIGGVGSYFMTDGVLTVGEENIAYTPSNVGSFSQAGGTHTINNLLSLATQTGTDATFRLSGGRLNAGSVAVGGGSLAVGGVARFTQDGGTFVTSGRVRVYGGSTLSVNGGSFSAGSLALNGGGRATLGPGADITPRVGALQATSGRLDIADNGLIVDYTGASPMGLPLGPFGSVANLIANAWNNGAWNGLGITSSFGTTQVFGVGYAEASTLYGISGSGTATFRGQTVDATSVLVLLTYYGDATLDRRVGIDDFAILASNFNLTGLGWMDGDFNYDENINIGDFALMAANWNLAFPAPRPGGGFATTGGRAAVPEPAAGMLIAGLASLVLGGRRRRR